MIIFSIIFLSFSLTSSQSQKVETLQKSLGAPHFHDFFTAIKKKNLRAWQEVVDEDIDFINCGFSSRNHSFSREQLFADFLDIQDLGIEEDMRVRKSVFHKEIGVLEYQVGRKEKKYKSYFRVFAKLANTVNGVEKFKAFRFEFVPVDTKCEDIPMSEA